MTTTIVVMGVSGSGKSTVAAELVARTGWVFAEGDDFHPEANVAKMHAGTPLTDDDRWPWLAAVAAWIGEQESAGLDAIVTCSALKRAYRDVLRDGHPSVWFAHITVPPDVLGDRLAHRTGHFMPPSLLVQPAGHPRAAPVGRARDGRRVHAVAGPGGRRDPSGARGSCGPRLTGTRPGTTPSRAIRARTTLRLRKNSTRPTAQTRYCTENAHRNEFRV